jgi:O-antigen ligase
MAKKKRTPETRRPEVQPPAIAAAHAGDANAGRAISAEAGSAAVATLLASALFLAPALGVPHEEMIQDTLKSIVVALMALVAALVFCWDVRRRTEPLRWHAVLWFPIVLCAYALGSMAWSHTYLAGVEAIRWFLFALLAWLALNTFSRERLPMLAWGLHAGAVVASLWTALQFWVDFRFFPQGPNPASTFVNRNFFAEFAVCTLPLSALLLARARQSAAIALLAASSALVLVAILMTGTRAALMAMGVQLLVVLPVIAWRYWHRLECARWRLNHWVLAATVMLGGVVALGSVPAGNSKILQEGRGATALERSVQRTASIGPKDESLGIRMVMWRATLDVIRARPLTGVGSGAWENEIPLYQTAGAQLETDYYVHNEFLQLVAEYGLAGWMALLALCAYLLRAAWRTWACSREDTAPEGPWRAALLCSLLALFIVSNIGFPWRLASTGAWFALALGALAASDARFEGEARWGARSLRWRPHWTWPATTAGTGALALALYISQQAAECERLIVQATKTAMSISASGDPNHPRWSTARADMLRTLQAGIAINPHYRKITPMVADELARWGDWKNATWIWESVLSSRPNVVAILTNVARGYTALGEPAKARSYLERARKIAPNAPAVRSLDVIIMARAGLEKPALQLARQALDDRAYDIDLLNTTFRLAARAGDRDLAVRAMALRQDGWPEHRLDGHLELGRFHASRGDSAAAFEAFTAALALASPAQRAVVQAQMAQALPSPAAASRGAP